MPAKKDPNWKPDLDAMIREGKTYEQCVAALTEKYGAEAGKVGASTYGKLKKLAFPDEKVGEVIGEVNEARREAKKKKRTFPAWTPAKQKAGDESQLANVINQVIFLGLPCPSGELKLEHVQEINVGGGIVNTVQYVFPQIDLGNPVLILVLRAGLLFVKVKKLCYDIKAKLRTGVNPLYERPVTPQERQSAEAVAKELETFSEHPTDKFRREHGIGVEEGEQDI